MHDVKVRLSTLWVFMLFNFLYADVMALFDPGIPKDAMTRDALLAASFLMEIPIAMIVASRVLKQRTNRLANVTAGAFMAIVQAGSSVCRRRTDPVLRLLLGHRDPLPVVHRLDRVAVGRTVRCGRFGHFGSVRSSCAGPRWAESDAERTRSSGRRRPSTHV